MNIVLLGPPGSGKGTLAHELVKEYNLTHISTGDLLRENINNNTEIGKIVADIISKGQLVSDEIVLNLLVDKLNNCPAGVILDGYPRNIAQARTLDDVTSIDAVIYLNVDLEVVLDRIVNRLTCPKCKAVSNRKWTTSDVCEICGTKYVVRADDNAETVTKRVQEYVSNTQPVVDYYKNKGILIEIDANNEPISTLELTKSKIRDMI